ncbi:MAG: sialate O-acetylesterase [Bacteroidales bacterium]|nr:sialate O-acetylesterase [Bacteroidales bacterium]
MNLSAQNPNFYIFLCFGQSNMEGQGKIEKQDTTVNDRFKVFQSLDCPNLSRSRAQWYPAKPPTCQCHSELSPADYFGRTMVANLPDSITVGIINVAIGGCDIRIFDKDIYLDYDSTYTEEWFALKVKAYGGNPYQHLVDLAKLAQKDGVIKGILLHQGETNTGQTEWPLYVKKIYSDMLADLALSAESVPLLAGEVLATEGSCCASMNSIINTLPDAIPTAHVISSSGCTAKDYAHFDSAGYRLLGKRYALKMLALMGIEVG